MCARAKPKPHTDMTRHNQLIRGDWNEANNALHAKLKPQETVKPKRTFASYMDDEWAHYVDLNWKASRRSRKAALCGVIFGHTLMR